MQNNQPEPTEVNWIVNLLGRVKPLVKPLEIYPHEEALATILDPTY